MKGSSSYIHHAVYGAYLISPYSSVYHFCVYCGLLQVFVSFKQRFLIKMLGHGEQSQHLLPFLRPSTCTDGGTKAQYAGHHRSAYHKQSCGMHLLRQHPRLNSTHQAAGHARQSEYVWNMGNHSRWVIDGQLGSGVGSPKKLRYTPNTYRAKLERSC